MTPGKKKTSKAPYEVIQKGTKVKELKCKEQNNKQLTENVVITDEVLLDVTIHSTAVRPGWHS